MTDVRMKRNAAWPLGVAHGGRFVPCAGNNGSVAQDHPGSTGHETAGAWHARTEGKESKAHHVDRDGQVLKVRKRHAGRGVLHIRAAVQGLILRKALRGGRIPLLLRTAQHSCKMRGGAQMRRGLGAGSDVRCGDGLDEDRRDKDVVRHHRQDA